MRQPHPASTDATEPRILPLPAAGVAVRGLIDEAVAAARSRSPAADTVAISIDAAAGVRIPGDAGTLQGLVDRLVAAAVAAAAAPQPRGEGPPLHEVVITLVETADTTDLEIADSGAGPTADDRCPAAVRDLAARCGCQLHVAACAEGGTAVTLRLPRRTARRQAA